MAEAFKACRAAGQSISAASNGGRGSQEAADACSPRRRAIRRRHSAVDEGRGGHVVTRHIEYYADKYKKLTREHKFAIPLCKRTNKNEIYNAIEATSNIPAGYYITAECTRDVEKFAQKLHGKFGHKDGPFYADEVAIKIFLHDLEHFLTDIYHTHFFSLND